MTPSQNTLITEESLQGLKSGLRGKVLQPGDEGYDPARQIWNSMIDRKPALIVRCQGAADVIAAVKFARQNNLLVAVRGGGHSVVGHSVCDGGLMIDLSLMKSVRVDPVAKTARAEGGCTWHDVDYETQAFGLAVTGGQVSHTGIGGLTLGGGFGYLARKFGLTIDNLLSVDIVTADGQLLHASSTENASLFWAVRGGGGNFGVVTSFEYQLHQLGPIVVGGAAFYPLSMAKSLLEFYRDLTENAPDELTLACIFMTAPPLPFVPPDIQGTKVINLSMVYTGPIEEGMHYVERIRAFNRPVVDMLGPIPYTVQQSLVDELTRFGQHYYVKGFYSNELVDGLLENLISGAETKLISPLSVIIITPLGGKIARVGPGATAYANREASYSVDTNVGWLDPQDAERQIAMAREFLDSIFPYTTGKSYVNLVADEGEKGVRSAYPPETYARLQEVKRKYDPANFFRLNQNIQP
jgi:FAD/FMN-containing dehydrogenase